MTSGSGASPCHIFRKIAKNIIRRQNPLFWHLVPNTKQGAFKGFPKLSGTLFSHFLRVICGKFFDGFTLGDTPYRYTARILTGHGPRGNESTRDMMHHAGDRPLPERLRETARETQRPSQADRSARRAPRAYARGCYAAAVCRRTTRIAHRSCPLSRT
jgi:hypothetical protein